MKTKIFMTLLLIAGLMPAVAQNYHPDTIDYPYSKYFYHFDRNKWLDGDTFVRSFECIMGPGMYDSVRESYIPTFKWDSVTLHVHHNLWASGPTNQLMSPPEFVYYNYTSRPIKVIGIAANCKTWYAYGRTPNNPSPYLSDSTEYLLFYDARPDTFVCRQRQALNAGDSVRLIRTRYRDTNIFGNNGCCANSTEYHATESFHEIYFDRPILVKDSFYLGGTNYSFDGYRKERNITHQDNPTSTILLFFNDWGGNWAFYHNPLDPTSISVDTCPPIPDGKIKTRYPRQPYSWERNLNIIPYQWVDDVLHEYSPQIYPIYEEMCPVVNGLRVEDRQGNEVTVTWNAHGSHTAWTVTYGPLGMPRDSFAVVACLQPSLTLTGLDSTMIYDISVQAQCDYHVSDFEPLDADVLNNRDTTFVSEQGKHLYLRGGNLVSINDVTPDDGILLRPNPADRQVTVSATLPLRKVEVYDLAGRLVETRQPNGTTLQLNLKSYPSGTYLVKVTTANGTSTKKLVVR